MSEFDPRVRREKAERRLLGTDRRNYRPKKTSDIAGDKMHGGLFEYPENILQYSHTAPNEPQTKSAGAVTGTQPFADDIPFLPEDLDKSRNKTPIHNEQPLIPLEPVQKLTNSEPNHLTQQPIPPTEPLEDDIDTIDPLAGIIDPTRIRYKGPK